MKSYITQLKEYLKTAGTCSILKEDKSGFPSYTADLTDLPNRTEFLKGLVALLDVPYNASKEYYSKVPAVMLSVGSVSLEDLPKCFPYTVYVEIAFRKTNVLLSLYETRYISTQGLLGSFQTNFFNTNMDFKTGDFIDVTSVHTDNNVGVFLVSRDFNLQEVTDDFVRSVIGPTNHIRVRELIQFGLHNGYWTTPVRKINLNVNGTTTELVVRATDGIDTARVVGKY